jgi:hypothetical protein
MRMLSLSLGALAALSLAPVASAQQAAAARHSNAATKSAKTMSQQKAHAKGVARYQAWMKNVKFKNATKIQNSKSTKAKGHAAPRQQGAAKTPAMPHKGMLKAKSVMHQVSTSPAKSEFSKRYKIKQAAKTALKARQKALMSNKVNGKR